MKYSKRRHNTGFGYIGFGNNTSVFNRKPKQIYSNLKNNLNQTSVKQFNVDFKSKTLTETDKLAIKKKVKQNSKGKIILSAIITLVVLILLVITAIYTIKGILK